MYGTIFNRIMFAYVALLRHCITCFKFVIYFIINGELCQRHKITDSYHGAYRRSEYIVPGNLPIVIVSLGINIQCLSIIHVSKQTYLQYAYWSVPRHQCCLKTRITQLYVCTVISGYYNLSCISES